ncbi:UNVERIFIED_CONTAM: Xyloglucan galactosyltransferase MUR3 [Sesamum calycinum]|uniref:Xyloglucan galactosyltransferase MUR3 n=1 Tax=Sesamum calycinum TaxID=2727403 RepID=A0AAW2RU35_9LAMI
MCKFTTNGLVRLENVEGVFSDTGWYATNQFAVDVIFGNRMKQYECLTNDSSLAAAIFVPFYAGFDIARRLTDQESDWGNKLLFLPAARNMSMLVVESSPWHGNDFGIPYPTYFHPAKDAEVLPGRTE